MDKKYILKVILYDVIASLLLGISVDVFAVQANFAPGGITGLAVIVNYLFHAPIGLAIVCINIPIILFTFRRLGKKFFLLSVKSMILSSFFIDYIVCYLPVYSGSRLIAAVLAGIFAGIGFSLFFYEGSSTGGTDFIVVAVKQWKPNMSLGSLVFIFDGIVIVLSVFVFKEIWSFVYGAIYTVVTSLALDATTKVLKCLIKE